MTNMIHGLKNYHTGKDSNSLERRRVRDDLIRGLEIDEGLIKEDISKVLIFKIAR